MKSLVLNIIVLIALITVFSCNDSEKKIKADTTQTIAVRVSSVSSNADNPFLSASGKVQSENSANLSTRMMGHVQKIYVKVGDKVNKGQLLLSVNNADISAKLAQVSASITEANAAYKNAEKDYNRYKSLFNDNSASQKELDDITAHYNMAKARLEAANQMKNEVQAQFSYANIRAPFNGVISNKFINEGDMANPGMPLLEIESPSSFQVMAMVPETEISQIKKNTDVNVLIKSLSSLLKGKVGTKIASDLITIVDDPFMKKSTKSGSFDDEGVATQYKELVKDGKLTGYLHNLKTAKKELSKYLDIPMRNGGSNMVGVCL